jgi:stringent starvation protein B
MVETPDNQGTPTRPYLLRALHDWCTDNGFTPYIAVFVGPGVQVPMEYVKNNEIVLNVGFEATSSLQLGNEFIEFKARFGGVAREIRVPVDHVVAIYARENGQGMAFPVPTEGGVRGEAPAEGAPVRGLRLASSEGEGEAPASSPTSAAAATPPHDTPPEPAGPSTSPGGRPALKRVK